MFTLKLNALNLNARTYVILVKGFIECNSDIDCCATAVPCKPSAVCYLRVCLTAVYCRD